MFGSLLGVEALDCDSHPVRHLGERQESAMQRRETGGDGHQPSHTPASSVFLIAGDSPSIIRRVYKRKD